MGLNRRQLVAGAGLLAASAGARGRRPTPAKPRGFLWGTAISAHQSEGNNTASDSWLLETITPTAFKDPSGGDDLPRWPACDALSGGDPQFRVRRDGP